MDEEKEDWLNRTFRGKGGGREIKMVGVVNARKAGSNLTEFDIIVL